MNNTSLQAMSTRPGGQEVTLLGTIFFDEEVIT